MRELPQAQQERARIVCAFAGGAAHRLHRG
jgi:hypothetical protein